MTERAWLHADKGPTVLRSWLDTRPANELVDAAEAMRQLDVRSRTTVIAEGMPVVTELNGGFVYWAGHVKQAIEYRRAERPRRGA